MYPSAMVREGGEVLAIRCEWLKDVGTEGSIAVRLVYRHQADIGG